MFHYLACIDIRGQKLSIYKRIAWDAELVKKLPLIFRTIRGQKVSSALLDELAEKIRKA